MTVLMAGLSSTHNTLEILITINDDLEVVKMDGKNLIRKVATTNAGYHITTTKFEVQTKPRVWAKSWGPSHPDPPVTIPSLLLSRVRPCQSW